jgi:ParB-like chromosome segregation protein Spo0J
MAKRIKNGAAIKAEQLDNVLLDDLKEHPRNYQTHPDDQLEHLMASIKKFGFYRRIVIAKDNTILAGHGVTRAARKMKLKAVPVLKLNIDPNSSAALKLLAGDNGERTYRSCAEKMVVGRESFRGQ